MSAFEPLITTYLAQPATLRQAVVGMSPQQAAAHPIPETWSTLEVVCHLADFEPVYADRMKRTIAEDRPQVIGADQNSFARHLAYPNRDLEEELTLIERTRSQMGRILRTLPDETFQRSCVHNEMGPMTLEQLLTYITKHIPHHLPFVLAKRQALGLPS